MVPVNINTQSAERNEVLRYQKRTTNWWKPIRHDPSGYIPCFQRRGNVKVPDSTHDGCGLSSSNIVHALLACIPRQGAFLVDESGPFFGQFDRQSSKERLFELKRY